MGKFIWAYAMHNAYEFVFEYFHYLAFCLLTKNRIEIRNCLFVNFQIPIQIQIYEALLIVIGWLYLFSIFTVLIFSTGFIK